MNTNTNTQTTLFQDRKLTAATPISTWQRLTAGDERANYFEDLLRTFLVICLLCAVTICGLRLHTQSDANDDLTMSMPRLQVPQVIEHSSAATAVRAVLP